MLSGFNGIRVEQKLINQDLESQFQKTPVIVDEVIFDNQMLVFELDRVEKENLCLKGLVDQNKGKTSQSESYIENVNSHNLSTLSKAHSSSGYNTIYRPEKSKIPFSNIAPIVNTVSVILMIICAV